MKPTADSIVEAAFRLFAEQGYENTSVDEIAAEAGVGRSSFFRHFGSKETVVFPDHDALLRAVEDRLAASSDQSAIQAVSDAVRLVLFHYVSEGDRARQRYRLTSTVTALRERELVSGSRYQRLFRKYISSWGDHSEESELRSELMAAAIIAAHNRVLRRWLQGEHIDPQVEIDDALTQVHQLFAERNDSPAGVLVLRTGEDLSAIVDRIRSER